jgi:hypothetical protein
MHQSRNAVLLAVQGRPLIARATDFEDGTQYYSVLQVNGQSQSKAVDYEAGAQPSPGKALPGVTDFEATGAYVTFSNEIGEAYPELETYRRRVVCVEPGIYIIADHAKAGRPVRMDFRLHFGLSTSTEFHPAAQNSPVRITGSHAGTPFTCAIISTDEMSADLGRPTGENASKTLRYGPPDQSAEFRVIVVIRLGDVQGRVLSAGGDQPNLMGVFIADSTAPLVVIMADDGAVHDGPIVARYALPKTVASTRNLVTGLAGSRRYSIRTKPAEEGVEVTVSFGDDIAASPQGNLLFDISSNGMARPVLMPALPAAQEVAEAIFQRSQGSSGKRQKPDGTP